ncbi:MAG: hypothetical protein AAFY71_11640 [Bacteroidota bacterium]
MKSFARTLYVMLGIVTPILIGSLHLYSHYIDLVIPEVQEGITMEVQVLGHPSPSFAIWGLMSFVMGLLIILLGLNNYIQFSSLSKEEMPKTFMFVIMIIFLLGVVYAGWEFQSMPHFYAGLVGTIGMFIGLGIRLGG